MPRIVADCTAEKCSNTFLRKTAATTRSSPRTGNLPTPPNTQNRYIASPSTTSRKLPTNYTAEQHTAKTTEQTLEKQRILEHIRATDNPTLKRAYQIRLQHHRRQTRTDKEYHALIAGARGENWDFSSEAKLPTTVTIPEHIDKQYDRGLWGNTLEAYLSDLYSTAAEDAESIHAELWHIFNAALHPDVTPLMCHPPELRDLIQTIRPRKAPGPDGAPSQLFRNLHFRQIKQIASLFTTLSNDVDFNPTTRPTHLERSSRSYAPQEATCC